MMTSDTNCLPYLSKETVMTSSRSSIFSNSSLQTDTQPPKHKRKLTKIPLELNLNADNTSDNSDSISVRTIRNVPSPSSQRSRRSSREIFNSSLGNRTKRTNITHARHDFDIYRNEPRNASLETERRVPIVEWKKIRSVPEVERADDTLPVSVPVSLNKCISCSTEGVILKLLPCLHSFCQPCLERKLEEHPSHSWFRCELCNKQIHTPNNDIDGFEDNVFFKFSEFSVSDYEMCSVCSKHLISCKCTTCNKNFCNECVTKHHQGDTKEHYVVNLSKEMVGKSSTETVCDDHSPFTLELFCLTCSEAICGRCAIHKHCNHIVENIKMTAIDRRNELKSKISGFVTAKSIRDIQDYVKACKREKSNVQNDVQNTVQSIQLHVGALKDELDQFGKTMIKDLIEKETTITDKLDKNIQEAERRDKATFVSMETLKQIVDRSRDLEIVNKYKNLQKVIVDVKRYGKPPPATSIRFKYKPLVNTIGPATGRLRVDAFLNKPVQYIESGAMQFNKCVTCIFPIDHTKAWIGYRKYIQLCGKDGTYGIRVDCQEIVSAIDANLHGTIFIACISTMRALTSKMTTKYLFNLSHEPSDMKINDKDQFIISFRDAKRVATFDAKGKALHDFDIRHFGFRFGIRINEPWKMAVSEREDIYLTDFSSEAVGVFDPQGEIKNAFETKIYRHASLCCDRGLLFIADYKRDCIHAYSQEGHLLQTCHTPGIYAPCSIAVDPSGDLWVGTFNGQTKIYTAR
ncbi:hypothetical protein ACF0H5_012193 [Mactra antiquata]